MSIMRKGIDVSVHQGNVNWANVKTDGIDFAIIRAGYGREISQKDKQFENNYAGCKSNGIPCGAYWYSYATTVEDAIKEANTFLTVLKGKTFEYPVYFDMEEKRQFDLGKEACTAIAKAFMDTVERAGYWVGLYMSTSYLNAYISEEVRNRYAVWVAQYSSNCTYKGQHGIWQYGIAGHPKYDTTKQKAVYGVNGQCDLDYCYIDYPTLIKNAGLNGFAKPTETAKPTTTTQQKPVEEEQYEIYEVVKNDNLWNIAKTKLGNGSRYIEIKKLNGLKSDTIHPGKKLKIPKK